MCFSNTYNVSKNLRDVFVTVLISETKIHIIIAHNAKFEVLPTMDKEHGPYLYYSPLPHTAVAESTY